MLFDALTMACVAAELRAELLGGRVQQVLLPDRLSVGLEVFAHQQRHYLLASAHPELGAVLLASDKLRRGMEKETGLLLLLRKFARGAALSAVEQPPLERVLRLEFDHPEWGTNHLVVEVMGRHSNLILVGPGNRVLDAAKRVDREMSPARPILPGGPYTPPPMQDKLSPLDLSEEQLQHILSAAGPDTPLWQALVGGLRGMSPLLAREVSFRVLGRPRAAVADAVSLAPLQGVIRELLAPLDDGCWQPSLVMEQGRPVLYAPYPLTHRGEAQPMASLSRAIELYTAAVASEDPYAAAKRPVREAIAAVRAHLERRRDALQRALDHSSAADRWREWGEWILAYAHTVRPGQAELLADTGSGEPLRIPLDPNLSAVDNAQACFVHYRKAQRAAEGVPARLQAAELALRDLEQLDTDLALAASRPEIDDVRAALLDTGYLRLRRPRAARAPRSQPLALTSPDGLAMLIGRNSRQNDEVTFRRAGSDDWWFHARGVPGAHLIVRAAGRGLPPQTVRRAAELAAYFSQHREEREVLVDYTQRRHVRRIPGAAPGLVTYSAEETIRVAPREPDGAG